MIFRNLFIQSRRASARRCTLCGTRTGATATECGVGVDYACALPACSAAVKQTKRLCGLARARRPRRHAGHHRSPGAGEHPPMQRVHQCSAGDSVCTRVFARTAAAHRACAPHRRRARPGCLSGWSGGSSVSF
jgi:hypothetical protein